MRAQMQAMAQRIDALEGDLAEAQAVAEVANATAEAANVSASQAVERGTAGGDKLEGRTANDERKRLELQAARSPAI